MTGTLIEVRLVIWDFGHWKLFDHGRLVLVILNNNREVISRRILSGRWLARRHCGSDCAILAA
jgi:hypothetical protein